MSIKAHYEFLTEYKVKQALNKGYQMGIIVNQIDDNTSKELILNFEDEIIRFIQEFNNRAYYDVTNVFNKLRRDEYSVEEAWEFIDDRIMGGING